MTPASDSVASLDGLHIVSLQGTPYDIGQRHGQLLKPQVQQVVAAVVSHLQQARGLDRAALQARVEPLRVAIPQTVVDELHGLADGASVAYEDLLLVQALPELAAWDASAGYIAGPPATRGGGLLLGIGVGLVAGAPAALAPLRSALTVFAVDAEGSRSWLGLGVAGMVGPYLGLNADGLGAGLLRADLPGEEADGPAADPTGIPLLVLVRRALEEAADINRVGQIVEGVDRTRPASLMLAQTVPASEAVALEAMPTEWAVRPAQDGRLVVGRHLRDLAPPRSGEAAADPEHDRIAAWLLDNSGSIDAFNQPLPRSLEGTDHLALATLQPVGREMAVTVAGSGGSEGSVVVLTWHPAEGRVEARRRELPPTDPSGGPGVPPALSPVTS